MRDRRRALGQLACVLLAAAGPAVLASAPASARNLTAPERAGLTATLDRFATATRDGDGAVVAATLPPRVVAVIAARRGIDSRSERQAIEGQIGAIQAAGLRKTVTFDLDHAAFGSLKDDTPYAVVDVHDVADGSKHLDIHVKALAFMEDGQWYLLTLGTAARLEWLRTGYPEFDGVALDDAPAEPKP